MNDSQQAWTSTLYGILPHSTKPQIWVVPATPTPNEGAIWSLPSVQLSQRIWFLHLGWVTQAMREYLAIDVTALRYLQLVTDEEQHSVAGIYVLENRQPDEKPQLDGKWIGQSDLSNIALAVPAHRAIIETHFAECHQTAAPEQRVPWAKTGWYDEADAWITTQVQSLGHDVTNPIEQVRVWGVSAVLRAQTTGGDFYFKCETDSPLLANEPQLTADLAELYPRLIPQPVSIDVERRWMLQPDFGNQLGWHAPPETLELAYRSLAEVQVALAGRTADLLAMGCKDRRFGNLLVQTDLLMDVLGTVHGLTASEVQELRDLAPQLKDMCHQLDALNIPPSLVHGDFYAGNIAVQGETCLIFDWAEGCVAHPFFDMLDLFEKDATAAQPALRESYLEPWRRITAEQTLEEAWSLAKPLSALHTAISSYHIVSSLEDVNKAQLGWAIPRWLRLLLRTMS